MAANAEAGLWRWQHSRASVTPPDLEPINFDGIAGWAADDHAAALDCYLRSASLTGLPVPEAGEVQSLLKDRQKARAFFEETFAAFRILAAPGLLTSYFEPVLKGSRKQSAAFPVPLYRRPSDLSPLLPGHPLSDRGLPRGGKQRAASNLTSRARRSRPAPWPARAGKSFSWRTAWKSSSCTFKAPG